MYKKNLYYNEQINTELYHLLCMIGVSPGENLEEKTVLDEVNDMMSSIKSQLMSKTKITMTTTS